MSIPSQQQQQRRYVAYKGTPPTGLLLYSTPTSSPYCGPPASSMSSDGTPLRIEVTGVGLFFPSRVATPPQQLDITPHHASHTTTYWGRRCWLILSISYHASFILVFRASSSPRCQKTRKRRRRTPSGTGTSRGSTTSSARSRVARIFHTPPPVDAFNRFKAQPIMPFGGLPPWLKPER